MRVFFDYYLGPLFVGLSMLAGLTVFLQRNAEFYLRLFAYFLVLTFIVEVIEAFLTFHAKSNLLILNPFTVLSICFYIWLLRCFIHSRKVRTLTLYLLYIYPAISLYNIYFIQKMRVFHTMTYSVGCLLIVGLCIYYFFELFQLTPATKLLRQPSFWICSGLLFFFSCSFPLYGLNNLVMRTASALTIRNLSIVFNFIYVFLYSFFTIAFLCRLRIRKST